ncbi:class I SAM-dependent methyltransferase [Candidatus Pelagibacter sp.]|nr:class I SAM-dependent methyltransferase [Candidatus Pelagibacter sp.]
MTKFFKNLYRLISIGTPFFIILNYIKNFLPNYKSKKKSLLIEKKLYSDFKSLDQNKKWFCNNLYYLDNHLRHLDNINNILEIGSYEGRSAIFFLKNFSNAKITCVDTWSGSDEHLDQNFDIIESFFDKNTYNYQINKRLIKIKDNSDNFFLVNTQKFDLIFVDGDHSSVQVKKDLYNSWKILNKGGYLILDDYLWWYYKDLKENPSTSINSFIQQNISDINNLNIWQQVIIQKI